MNSHQTPKDIATDVRDVVARYSLRNFIAIMSCSFILGGWAAKVQWDLSEYKSDVIKQGLVSDERLKEWWLWRQNINTKVDKHDYEMDHHRDRINGHEERLKRIERPDNK